MFEEIVKTIELGGRTLELTTGKIARQADGAVMVKMGGTVLLCTAVSAKEPKEGIGFFPLTIHYKEMAFAAGKIPGGFFKREGKGSEKEVLVSRLIDRPIRPLFHPAFLNETQVICTVLSYDPECNSDILAIIGASAALALSAAPYQHIVAASRVGLIDGNFILNPSFNQLKTSKLDLVVAGTDTSVMMVESEADLLSEEQMLEAIEFGHKALQPVIELINDLVKIAGKPKLQPTSLFPASLKEQISSIVQEDIKRAFAIKLKQERLLAVKNIYDIIKRHFAEDIANNNLTNSQIEFALKEVESEVLRQDVLKKNTRIDGRKPADIRNIACEIAILPKTHGSSLFTRGETQSLVVTTLGTGQDEQIVDSLDGEYKERFMLNYIFPPYSVGEATPVRAPGRREIGHGKLAWRAINRMLPTKEQFPYTIRVVSEITASNGSSSMATICGGSMALMDAGVPIKTPIAGIAMGLIKEGDKFVILSDIIGDEDNLGDMDFKVAGGTEGITALQMDIKISGVTFEIMKQALVQAKTGRIHILQEMDKAINKTNNHVSQYAPCIYSFKIDKDKIRDVIGPGGKVIREICDTTSAKIDISDDGNVTVSAIGKEKLDMAIAKIKLIAIEPEIGGIFNGTVVKILESGAFINYLGNRDGFIHISEISKERIESVSSVLKHGDVVKVKLIGFDNKGKAKLTIKNIDATVTPNVTTNHKSEPYKDNADINNNKRESAKKWQNNKPSNEDETVTKERKYFN
ncbi:polyribonucleotide nucleotidyltransferase [Rickettsia endosymbiont of Culicoides newsteadi]|uniref:polyribonucleotide nucleotidyltransferase n=1 Tax=Rickettsia endosymbiont of Culicoides newsteadi TaxID=1961830 RepID=UPI000B9B034A|nr:polyribonucleotide nucleotidyltransferase [Rickettsia endosymbiont of Culicoides newsteadi]OZG32077.1 polyribonucleotide nucleotidyltransferase [Rickettsia endosymbiont of Culicoides newsteadi]